MGLCDSNHAAARQAVSGVIMHGVLPASSVGRGGVCHSKKGPVSFNACAFLLGVGLLVVLRSTGGIEMGLRNVQHAPCL
jgi:hypothetical protein